MKIGFDYGRDVAGVNWKVDLDVYENSDTGTDPQVDDRLVTMAAEVCRLF